MQGTTSLNIPIKSYLQKYLVQKFGTSHTVSRRSWLGNYILDLLDKNYSRKRANIDREAYYSLIIPVTIIKTSGFHISARKIADLEVMIEKVFRNDLYSYVDVSVASGLKFENTNHNSINQQNAIKAIGQFLKFYNIKEDELSADTIYKDYYRNSKTDKNKDTKNKKAVKSCA